METKGGYSRALDVTPRLALASVYKIQLNEGNRGAAFPLTYTDLMSGSDDVNVAASMTWSRSREMTIVACIEPIFARLSLPIIAASTLVTNWYTFKCDNPPNTV
uniref:Uncharacterized protein n=1 Tax=Glossina austeni TaxID=7395 RepID=A0A1A9VF60_GLOAU